MIIITGASRSIGKYLFDKFSNSAEVVVGTYNSTPVDDGKFSKQMFQVDISDLTSVQNFFNNIRKKSEQITLINCAGVSYNSFLHKSDPAEWKRVIDTNLMGTYYMIRIILPLMREQGYGRIINFSSVVAQKGTPGVSAYAASKSALWGLSKSLAQENGSKGITINNINLGYVTIGMGVEQVPEVYQEKIKSQIPNNSFCDPEDIFRTVEFFRNTPYLNGVSIDLSGGLI
jgi:acetoacetyl-CoA reductase/3-oxoacyl-[acyl-carrier protein] reductase